MDEIKISISVNPVRTDLLSQLLESLANEGFTLKKSDNCISRKTETGFEQIGFVIYNYWPHCVEIGQAVFSVRFDAVEKIIAPIDVANGLRSDLHGALYLFL